MDFKRYRRTQFSEIRKVAQKDLDENYLNGGIVVHETKDNAIMVSISDVDLENGSPKLGDVVARNPNNHLDQWLISEEYFNNNFEEY